MTTNPRAGAPPGKQNGRPMPRNGRPNAHSTSTTQSVHARADEAAARDWYALGFNAGVTVGRFQLDHELTGQDRRRMAYMHDLSDSPAYAELELRRWGPGGREHFGDPRPGDFKGFGADYEPSQYYVPLHPGGASAHRPRGHLRVIGDGQGAA